MTVMKALSTGFNVLILFRQISTKSTGDMSPPFIFSESSLIENNDEFSPSFAMNLIACISLEVY